jgi:predicted dehydrogenase
LPNHEQGTPATRREFVSAAALTAASYGRIAGANDRIGVGVIGFGLIGKQHVTDLKKFDDVELRGLCDVYKPRVEEGLAYIGNPNAKGYADFRRMYENRDIDGVVVATPDHWHALLTILACAAGKDVYVEKPLTVFIDEGKWMLEARAKYKRVVVVGTQRRHARSVTEARRIVESGVLGKIQAVRMSSTRNVYPGFGKTPVEAPPADLDYDMWLGPAPKRPYQNHRSLYHFRWFWDYSGGQMTNLGAHAIDQLQYIMGAKGPSLVMSLGGRFALEDDGETPDEQEAIFRYPGGWVLNFSVREANAFRDSRGSAIMGSKGTLMLGSNELIPEMHGDPANQIPPFAGHPAGGPKYSSVKPRPWFEPAKGVGRGAPGSGEDEVMVANKRDWISAMRSRKRPLCDLEDGHRVAVTCHLANMSLRLGRSIRWDPETEHVVGDKEAAAMCTRPYRAPWDKALARA